MAGHLKTGDELCSQETGVHPGHARDQAGVEGVGAQVGDLDGRETADRVTRGLPMPFAGQRRGGHGNDVGWQG